MLRLFITDNTALAVKHFLVPTDFSENARNAFTAALHLAQLFNAKVTLCAIYDQPSSGQSVLRNISEQLKNNTLEDLEQEVDDIRASFPDVEIAIKAVQGDTAEMIDKTADLERADLIVMGKTGRSGLSNKLFGSVALQTINHTDHTLLLVPQDWKYKPIDKICLASDLSDLDYKQILKPMIAMAQAFGAPVETIHFAEDQEALDKMYANGHEAKQQIDAVLDIVKHRFAFAIKKNVRQAIFDHLDTADFHIMCMIKHEYPWVHKAFHSSPTVDAAIRTQVPLLIL